jgi:hypothetical protein
VNASQIAAERPAPTDWRELASRDAAGLAVLLLWSRSADRIKVTVADARYEEELQLDVARADALTAFYHPFAYVGSSARAALPWRTEQEAA